MTLPAPGLRGYVLASAALHLLVLAGLSRHPAPTPAARVAGRAALQVQLLNAPARASAAGPVATRRSVPMRAEMAARQVPSPAVMPMGVPTEIASIAPAPAPPLVETDAHAASWAEAPPQATAPVAGSVFALPTVAGFGGGGWRPRSGQGTAAAPSPVSADIAAALPWQQAQQAQQWQQARAQAVHLQQAWAAMQAQLAQWPAPTDPDLAPCALPRVAEPRTDCPAWTSQPGWLSLVAAAQAFYQLAPARHDLVLAYAGARYRLELLP